MGSKLCSLSQWVGDSSLKAQGMAKLLNMDMEVLLL